jgi:hypothetical protein
VQRWQRGLNFHPLCHGARHAFFPVGGRSINSDAGSRRSSLDLCYGRSYADGSEAWRPEFENEHSFVGFAIGRDRIRFVVGEDGCEAAVRVKHQTDMVQFDASVVQGLPDAEAYIPAGGWKKCIFKFSSIPVPSLEGFEEREGCGRRNELLSSKRAK